MEKRRLGTLVASAGFAAFMMFGINKYIAVKSVSHELMTTWTPNVFISPNTMIRSYMLQEVTIPKSKHDSNAYVKKEDIAGKTSVTAIGIGEEFASWKLTDRPILPKSNESLVSFTTDNIKAISNKLRRGDKVDVWVDFNEPKFVKDPVTGETQVIGTAKIIKNLLIANVKTAEGKEVEDIDESAYYQELALSGRLNVNDFGVSRFRQEPTGAASAMVYVMSPEIYNAYVTAGLSGNIRLQMHNPFDRADYMDTNSSVTKLYDAIKLTTMFMKNVQPVQQALPGQPDQMGPVPIPLDLSLLKDDEQNPSVDFQANPFSSESPDKK